MDWVVKTLGARSIQATMLAKSGLVRKTSQDEARYGTSRPRTSEICLQFQKRPKRHSFDGHELPTTHVALA